MQGRNTMLAIVFAVAMLGLGGTAGAAEPTIVVGADGTTAPAFSYVNAIRERVFIPVPGVDQDLDGVVDRTAIDIIRPAETNAGLKAPAIIDPSPYYTTLGRGHEGQLIADLDGDGLNDKWPLFYDNYFVPRGYAMILADMDGTGNSTGCPMHGGPGDIASMKVVVDWLNGRTPGFDKDGNAKVADWHNGKAAMIGKSYDGTLANGVAATGVDGLTTIVPVSAISRWYDYSRTNGVRQNNNYPAGLANTVTNADRRTLCAPTRDAMSAIDGDEHGDINAFWHERDHLKDADKVKASVFITHGFQDDNVRFDHGSRWWDALEANNVPRKMWLTRTGHEDPFDFRRAHWVATLHRWFDFWLQGLPNGIMDEPKVDIEVARDVFETASDWPIPESQATDVFLRGTAPGSAGNLALGSGGATDTLSWTDGPGQSESTMMNNPLGSQANRRVFLSPKLKTNLRISGTPVIDIEAAVNRTQTNLGALLVEYGPTTQVSRTSDGIITDPNDTERSCWGESSPNDSACYLDVTKPEATATVWRVSRGIMDTQNRESLFADAATPITIDQEYRFTWPTFPHDYVFKAGNQIGIVLVANYQSIGINGTTGATVTLDTKTSKVGLPIVGGAGAAAASGAFDPDTTAPTFGPIEDVAAETTDPGGAAVTYPLPTATDTQDPAPVVTCAPPSGSLFGIGSTTVNCTARDANGNTSTASFVVTLAWIDEDDGDVGGDVPPTLSLALSGAASFGAFTPGLAHDYFATLAANVTSTAAGALLTVADPSTTATGHLVNGTFALPAALQAKAASAGGMGGDYAAIGGTALPTQLLSYAGPVSNDAVTVDLKQSIGATDALRTGTYSKTLTFTLSTSTP